MIPVRCDCGERYDVPDHMAGERVKCEACGQKLTVPSALPQAAHFGLSTAKYVARTAESDLTPDQIRRIAKRRGKELNRTGNFWTTPMFSAAAGGGSLGLILFFLLFGVAGLIVAGIFLGIVAMFAAFFNRMNRNAADADMAALQKELEEVREVEPL